MVYEQTPEDLQASLREQVQLLRDSAGLFDAGQPGHALNLAVRLRVMLHDTKGSHSLLGQIGIKERLTFLDTALDPEPGNEASTAIVMIHLGTSGSQIFTPPLGNLSPRRQRKPRKSFDEWWHSVVILDRPRNEFTREGLVLALAHWEGGAHVDPEWESAYADVAKNGSLGWILSSESGIRPLIENPVPASVRQIAFEVDQTLTEQVPELVPT